MLYGPESQATRPTQSNSARIRRAFTLIELLVVVSIIATLIAILIPSLGLVRSQALRVKCSTNLRAIAMAMLMYSGDEPDHGFPRAIYRPSQNLQLDNAGYLVPNTFGSSGYVGDNNVPAALFLLMKSELLQPKLFICPATAATPGFPPGPNSNIQLSSNWEAIPDNMTYSLATPYPDTLGSTAGFAWRDTLHPTFAILSDINPGTRGGSNPADNVTGVLNTSTGKQLLAANSNNHQKKGQNVAYLDLHVSFERTPFCGANHAAGGMPDNIFTAGIGNGGICSELAFPVDPSDSVMLPTDDPGGK